MFALKHLSHHPAHSTPYVDIPLNPGAHVYLLVNALGGITAIEVYCVVKEAVGQLQAMGVTVVRTLAGVLCSSLDMRGVSISVLNMGMAGGDLLALLDAPTNVRW